MREKQNNRNLTENKRHELKLKQRFHSFPLIFSYPPLFYLKFFDNKLPQCVLIKEIEIDNQKELVLGKIK